MALADDGLKDAATEVRGWNQKADVGFQPVGGGLFYVAANRKVDGRQTADLTLMRWTGDAQAPFVPATAKDRDALASASGRAVRTPPKVGTFLGSSEGGEQSGSVTIGV